MKTAKYFFIVLMVGFLAITMNSCVKCDNEDPQARIINNETQKASVEIKTAGGITANISNVGPGNSSTYSSYVAGNATFTITINNVDYVKTVNMSTCYIYDIAIDANNNITYTAIDKNK